MSDAAILERLDDGAEQIAAGIGLPVLSAGDRAAALVRRRAAAGAGPAVRRRPARARDRAGGGAVRRADDHRGVARRVERVVTALADEFTPDPDTVRVLGMAGAIVALTGLIGGAVLVAVTTRIAQQARALPTWAVWVSYAVAVLCLSGFWSGGMASVAFALWLIGAVIGVLRVAKRDNAAPKPSS